MSTRLDITDTISSISATTQQVVHWTTIILADVSSCMGHPLLIMEVERRKCYTESEWSTIDLCRKLRRGNVVPSPNHTAVESCADGLNLPLLSFWPSEVVYISVLYSCHMDNKEEDSMGQMSLHIFRSICPHYFLNFSSMFL